MKLYMVFASNLKGSYATGSALYAKRVYGAEEGVISGVTGKAYAIPIRNENMELLHLEEIRKYVDEFILFARKNSGIDFWVETLGCRSGEYEEKQISSLFKNAPDNVFLPDGWR